jgi:lactoylglutathione lyase
MKPAAVVPAASLLVVSLLAQSVPARPKTLGIAHMAVYVSDFAKARTFYKDFLGFDEEAFTLKKSDGSERIVFIKINDQQYLELFNEAPKNDGRLNHISIYTDDADRLRTYLASRGVKVPDVVGKGQTGNKNFNIKDPDEHTVEIVEYQPDSWTSRENGNHMPDTRIGTHIMHVGFLVGDLDKSTEFYGGILGFKETWRGGGSPAVLSWVNLRVPDGDDYVEFMLYSQVACARPAGHEESRQPDGAGRREGRRTAEGSGGARCVRP